MNSARALLVLLGVMFCENALAGVAPPPQKPSNFPPTTRHAVKPPAADFSMGSLSVVFGVTTLGEVQHAAGEGQVGHRRRDGKDIRWLCYGFPGQRVWFISTGATSGFNHVVTEVNAKRFSGAGPAGGCPTLVRGLQPALLHGFWLGASGRAVEKALGAPSSVRIPWLYYDFQTTVAALRHDNGSCRVSNWAKIKIQDGVVTFIAAGQPASC